MSDPSFVRGGRLRLLGVAVAAVVGLAIVARLDAFATPSETATGGKPTIVLEHGAWADASSWRGVIERLQAKGFTVLAPPNHLRGGKVDSAYLATFLSSVTGPIVLVGHSYGGYVITNAAVGNPAVKALVYVDAFIPEVGENLLQRTTGSCLSGDPTKNFRLVPSPGGVDLYIKTEADPPFPGLADCFATGVPAPEAAVVAAVQRPIALHALAEPSGVPAWRTIPSWALVGTSDAVITPEEQEFMATRANARTAKVDAGHLSLITRPDAVTDLVITAANATS